MDNSALSTAVIGGGCFWCIEAVYKPLNGIAEVTSGYAGGHVANPSYEQVCTGDTGHAEVVKLLFNPAKISYEQVIRLFFKAHDPTTLNRQGADSGTQYRSIILYGDAEQERIARGIMSEVQKSQIKPIVTELVPLKEFYSAEEYHQDYYRNNPNFGYCAAVIRPKMEKLGLEGLKAVDVLDLKIEAGKQ